MVSMKYSADALALVLCGLASARSGAQSSADPSDPAQLIGLWRGTSTCTDRVAAPSCHDEQVVYEFTAGKKPGTVHWIADKLVNGQRENMGELDLTYERTEHDWKAEFSSPRVNMVWRLAVDGTHLSGTGRQLPGNVIVRKLDLRKDRNVPRPKSAIAELARSRVGTDVW